MRSQAEWAKKHRNGYIRAKMIVMRQDRINPITTPSSIKYRSEQEAERRKRQIASGQLNYSNGLRHD